MINSEQYVNEIPAEFADVPSHVLQMLMQLGFVACGKGYPSLAIDIFTGISAVRPNSELPLIGLAFAHVHMGNLSAACELLVRKAAVINPQNQLVKTLLAMIYRITGEMGGSEQLLDEVIDDGGDVVAVEFAKHLKTENFEYLRSRQRY